MLNSTFTPFPILSTKRLKLRPLTLQDEQNIFSLRSDSEINKYLDRPPCNTIDDARNFIDKIISNNALYWAITFHHDDTLMGTICLFGFSGQHLRCETGYELLTSFQGQGIMKEALEGVIDYAFDVLQTTEIDAFVHIDNQRSIILLEKLSFNNSNEVDQENPNLVCYRLINSTDREG